MYSLFVAKARQAADELARLTSAGHKDMEHKVRNVRLGARVGGENPLLLDAIRPSSEMYEINWDEGDYCSDMLCYNKKEIFDTQRGGR